MATIQYDQALVEQSTFRFAKLSAEDESDLHRATDPLYRISDEEDRQRSFGRVYREFFTKFGLDRVVADLIAERPLIGENIDRCIVREAYRAKEESADLFGPQEESDERSQSTLVILARPESLVDSEVFTRRMHRELLHVSDMFDERFGYERNAIASLPARQSLVRDRYRVLWDIYVEGRIDREKRSDTGSASSLKRAFTKVFSGLDSDSYQPAFDRVFGGSALTHTQLLEWASNPGLLFETESGSPTHASQSSGGRCPLCGFPTHDWFDFDGDSGSSLAKKIAEGHPSWTSETGACRQCAEMFFTVKCSARD